MVGRLPFFATGGFIVVWKDSSTPAVGRPYRDIEGHSGFEIFGCLFEFDGVRWRNNRDIFQFILHHFTACEVDTFSHTTVHTNTEYLVTAVFVWTKKNITFWQLFRDPINSFGCFISFNLALENRQKHFPLTALCKHSDSSKYGTSHQLCDVGKGLCDLLSMQCDHSCTPFNLWWHNIKIHP